MRPSPLRSLVLLLALAAATACGPGARHKALQTTLAGVNAAATAFAVWDRSHQATIVAASKTEDEKAARLVAYRTERHRVDVAITAAFSFIAAAALDDATDLSQVLRSAARAKAAIDELRSSPPEVTP